MMELLVFGVGLMYLVRWAYFACLVIYRGFMGSHVTVARYPALVKG